MSLVFGAICPHPPLLIPAIGRKNIKKLKKTETAMKSLAEFFYQTQPETVIIISPHASVMAEAFCLNSFPLLEGNFNDFGDLDSKFEFKTDLEIVYKIKESVETKIPLILLAEKKLDHGSLVPLYFFSQTKRIFKVVPLSYSLLSYQLHFSLGKAIRKIINQSNKRIAVIASGDLSHCLTKKAPMGFSAKGKEFDQLLIKLIKEKKAEQLLNLPEELIKAAAECGYRSILILQGIFDGLDYSVELLSYQAPFGVGYLVANFIIK